MVTTVARQRRRWIPGAVIQGLQIYFNAHRRACVSEPELLPNVRELRAIEQLPVNKKQDQSLFGRLFHQSSEPQQNREPLPFSTHMPRL